MNCPTLNYQLFDAGASLRLVVNGSVKQNILKQSVVNVLVIRGSIVKIELGQGPLWNIYLPYSKVTFPITASADQLRELIAGTWLAGMDPNANLSTILSTTDSIKQQLSVFQNPLRTDVVSADTTYYGYAALGTAPEVAGWAIKKVVTTTVGATITWASGNQAMNKIWNQRLTLTYL